VLNPIASADIDELTPLNFQVTARDADTTDILTFRLLAPPAGASINATSGQFTWTPTEAQRPSNYLMRVVVSDNGIPSLSATQSFSVVVNEFNQAPMLAPVPKMTGQAGTPLAFTASAEDPDSPINQLRFSLLDAPTGATIDGASGQFAWTPAITQAPGDYTFRVMVVDDGTPSLSAAQPVSISVLKDVQLAPRADLLVVQTASPLKPFVSQWVTFTIGLSNAGPNTATNVLLNDFLPARHLYKDALVSQGGLGISNAVVYWVMSTLPAGASATLQLTLAPQTTNSFVNTATVTSSTYDPNPANNFASAMVFVDDRPGFHTPKVDTDGGLTLDVGTQIGMRYRVDVSTDMLYWTELTTFTGDGSSKAVKDAMGPLLPQRYYRAIQLP
jgi:uncharacterized repeat protein (TIGR01451 family)